jgi:signal transduction histidine kinase
MRWYVRLASWIFPARASTQTWLILTFALFVGTAVIAMGVYVTTVIRGDIREATEQTLLNQAERIAHRYEATPEEDRRAMLRTVSAATNLEIRVFPTLGNGVVARDGFDYDESPADRPTRPASHAEPVRIYERSDVGTGRRLYVELYRPRLDATIQLVQPAPPLLALVERMQIALIVGMISALLLAMFGSWVAAIQITKPLLAIRRSARNIAEGHFDERIRVDSRAREFHEVAQSLNLMSESYREKIDELERLARLQNEFIGNVSHEVKNPIFAVSGYLEALGSDKLSPEIRRRYAEKGLLNLERLNGLFSDLIEIARLEYREDLIRESEFDLTELIDEVIEMLRPKAERKQIELVYSNPSLRVVADRNRIRQVLINLIDNAIAYSDAGAVRCRIRRHMDKVRIEIVDNGRGIDDGHLERIFERFYRVDPDRSRKSGGTGLGLSIVKQILQAHGESIHVESTVNRGSRFWFELPFAGDPSADADA